MFHIIVKLKEVYMKLTKIETNIKRKLYLNITKDIYFSPTASTIENQVINIYPHLQSQAIIGFGAAITRECCICIIKC